MNIGHKVIYGLWTPKMFVNFNESQYLYFMHINTFFLEQVRSLASTHYLFNYTWFT